MDFHPGHSLRIPSCMRRFVIVPLIERITSGSSQSDKHCFIAEKVGLGAFLHQNTVIAFPGQIAGGPIEVKPFSLPTFFGYSVPSEVCDFLGQGWRIKRGFWRKPESPPDKGPTVFFQI